MNHLEEGPGGPAQDPAFKELARSSKSRMRLAGLMETAKERTEGQPPVVTAAVMAEVTKLDRNRDGVVDRGEVVDALVSICEGSLETGQELAAERKRSTMFRAGAILAAAAAVVMGAVGFGSNVAATRMEKDAHVQGGGSTALVTRNLEAISTNTNEVQSNLALLPWLGLEMRSHVNKVDFMVPDEKGDFERHEKVSAVDIHPKEWVRVTTALGTRVEWKKEDKENVLITLADGSSWSAPAACQKCLILNILNSEEVSKAKDLFHQDVEMVLHQEGRLLKGGDPCLPGKGGASRLGDDTDPFPPPAGFAGPLDDLSMPDPPRSGTKDSKGGVGDPGVGAMVASLVDQVEVDPPLKYKFYVYLGAGCSGSLVAPDVVLTSAYCADKVAFVGGKVALGIHNRWYLDNTRGTDDYIDVACPIWVLDGYCGEYDSMEAYCPDFCSGNGNNPTPPCEYYKAMEGCEVHPAWMNKYCAVECGAVEFINISGVSTHPKYDPNRRSYDFAIIKLESQSRYADHAVSLITPCAHHLPGANGAYFFMGFGTGWYLQEISRSYLDDDPCHPLMAWVEGDPSKSAFCASRMNFVADYGSPLMVKTEFGTPIQVGVGSFALSDVQPEFGKVRAGYEWIRQYLPASVQVSCCPQG